MYNVTSLWSESTITWNTRPSFSSIAFTSANGLASVGWMQWVVTNTVQAWVKNTLANNGFLINETSQPDLGLSYWSKDYQTDTTLRPYLSIDYTPNTAPSVPVLTSHSNFHSTASTTVEWSASTDPEGDSVSYNYYVMPNSYSSVETSATLVNTSSLSSSSFQEVAGINYYFWSVRSCDVYNICSAWATEQEFHSINSAPSVPVLDSNSGYHNAGSYRVNWSASTDPEGDTPLSYNFRVGTTDGGQEIGLYGTSSLYFLITAPSPKTTYYYSVQAWDNYNNGANSAGSAWATSKTFSFTNNIPVVDNITLTSSNNGLNTTNLSISMNGTDSDSDSLTKHYIWYKNGTMNTSWNDTTTLIYSGNYTTGDLIYVKGYANDTFDDSTQLQSNTITIYNNNTKPLISGISLNPTTKKYNKTIWVNTSNNITDTESTLVQLQLYYMSGSSKTFLNNSTWFAPPNNTSVLVTIPWNDGINHTIYGQVIDNGDTNQTTSSNLTSDSVNATFTSDITAPTLVSSSLSATTITTGAFVTITAQFNGQGANISSASVKVQNSLGTSTNYSMTCENGEIVNCTYIYTFANVQGQYDVMYFYPTDDSSNTGGISSSLTFTAYAPVVSSGSSSSSGGGSPSISTPALTATPLKSLYNISIKPSVDGSRSLSDIASINDCLTQSFYLSNSCTGTAIIVLTDSTNWYTLLGTIIASVLTMFVLEFKSQKKRSYIDALIYSVLIIITTLIINLVGFNAVFLFNYLFSNSLSALTFASFFLYGVVGTILLDSFLKPSKKGKE